MAKKKTTAVKTSASKSKVSKSTGRKSVVSAPAKNTTVSKTSDKKVLIEKSPSKPLKLRKSYIALILITGLLIGLLFFFRSLFVAAVVNGQPISRVSVIKETEKQAGKQTINNLVRNTLIEQEAKKQNVTVTEKEINEEIKKVETTLSKQNQKIDQVLAVQGLTRADLKKLIRLDKLVSKMVGKDIKISDKEIDSYIEKNAETLPKEQPEAQLRKSVSDTLRQQQLNQKVQTWLASLQSKAKIQYFIQY